VDERVVTEACARHAARRVGAVVAHVVRQERRDVARNTAGDPLGERAQGRLDRALGLPARDPSRLLHRGQK